MLQRFVPVNRGGAFFVPKCRPLFWFIGGTKIQTKGESSNETGFGNHSPHCRRLIAAAADERVVDELRVRFLGKKGELTAILKQMGKLSAEERPVVGALANEIREQITEHIAQRTKQLANAALEKRLEAETIDVTLPGNRPAKECAIPLSRY